MTQINITVSPYHLLPARPIPAAPPTSVALCRHCGEFGDCQHITTQPDYPELAGDYCDECRTTALIYLSQENQSPTITAAEHRDILQRFIAHRGERGVTDAEAHALAAWVNQTHAQAELLSLLLSGEIEITDIHENAPLFNTHRAPLTWEPQE